MDIEDQAKDKKKNKKKNKENKPPEATSPLTHT
jgi:hypothetical protein